MGRRNPLAPANREATLPGAKKLSDSTEPPAHPRVSSDAVPRNCVALLPSMANGTLATN